MTSIFDNPVIFFPALFIVIAVVYFKYFKNKTGFKDFKAQPLGVTTHNDLKNKLREQGHKIKKGQIVIGCNVISRVNRWIAIKGKFSKQIFDRKTRKYKIDDKDPTIYNLLILRAQNKFILWRLIGIKYEYYILDNKNITFNELTKSWKLPADMDIMRYADTWVNCDAAVEYINDISFKRMVECSMTHVENMPDRVVHLEVEQAKRNQLKVAEIEAYKSRYDESKKAEDTRIE